MIQNTRKSARAADYTEDLRIKQWLGPADTYINYTSAFALHHENTGRWFLEGSRYESFRDTPDARLWLRGIPGCGKTVLASTVIHDLQRCVGSAASTVIFFFFSFSNESKQKLDHMLRSLIFQLSERHQTAKDRLVVEFKEHDDGRKPLHGTALQSVFGQMVDTVQNVTIVLDALDESTTRPELLKWITSFPSGHGRFLLTSRSEMEIEDFLTSWLPSNCAITLENEPVGDDIKAYVHHRLETERNLSRWRSMHNTISDTLVEKASGMSVCSTCTLSSYLLRWKCIFADKRSGFNGYIASSKSFPGVWIKLPYDSCCRLSLSTSMIPMTVSSRTYRAREFPTPSNFYSFLLSQNDRCRFES